MGPDGYAVAAAAVPDAGGVVFSTPSLMLRLLSARNNKMTVEGSNVRCLLFIIGAYNTSGGTPPIRKVKPTANHTFRCTFSSTLFLVELLLQLLDALLLLGQFLLQLRQLLSFVLSDVGALLTLFPLSKGVVTGGTEKGNSGGGESSSRESTLGNLRQHVQLK